MFVYRNYISMQNKRIKYSEDSLLDAFRERHGFKYRYPSFPEELKPKTHMRIICPTHGEFLQTIGHHLEGQGCPKCAIARSRINQRLGRVAWILRFESVHGRGKYDYSKVTGSIKQHERVEIFCPEHNVTFYQTPNQHWRFQQGCPKCGLIKRKENRKKNLITRREYEKKARAIHGLAFEYSELPLEFSLNDNIIIFCNEHNHIFFCIAQEHLNGKGCSPTV